MPPASVDYIASTPLFVERIKDFSPKVILNLGSKHESYVREAATRERIPLVTSIHPASPGFYETIETITANWEEVKTECPYLS